MAETLSEEEVYIKLREFLDRLPGGYPETQSGVELRILKKLFSPQQAVMAMQLTLEPEPASVIAVRCGMDEDEASDLLESMARKGLIWRFKEGDEPVYQAAQFVVGIYEMQVKDIDKEFAEMLEEYFPYAAMAMASIDTMQVRTVPVGNAVEAVHAVATYDSVRDLVEQQELISVAPCVCRKEQRILGNDCGHTLENCMGFGRFAQHYIEYGYGKEIGKEAAMKILDQAEEEALVLTVNNAQDIDFVCSCCGCCCGALRILNLLPNPADLVVTSFQAQIDPEFCNACGECVDRCQLKAIVEGEEFMQVDKARCIGCGLCVTACPEDAVSLQLKPEVEVPPLDWDETMARILEERGLV